MVVLCFCFYFISLVVFPLDNGLKFNDKIIKKKNIGVSLYALCMYIYIYSAYISSIKTAHNYYNTLNFYHLDI